MAKSVILTGGTGMIGGLILQSALKSSEVKKVTSIVRKSSGVHHDKLNEVVLDDFLDHSKIESEFKGIDVAYYCLGVYTGAVPREKFREITVNYTEAFASILKKNSPQAAFCFLSGAGADRTEKSRMMFAEDKGAAENFLVKQDFKRLHIFRPGYIYPVAPRKEPNVSYKIMRWMYPALKWIFPGSAISSTKLADSMFKVGLEGGEKEVYENKDIQTI